MGAAELTKEVNQLEEVRLEVNTGSSPKAAKSELGSDMDDVDVLLNDDQWDIEDTDPTDAIDPDETVEGEAQPYAEKVSDAMAEAEEAIINRENGPAAALSHVHHASPEKNLDEG